MSAGDKNLSKKISKKFTVNMDVEVFDCPPCGDILVLGSNAAIGPKAAEKMLETLCPGIFEVIKIDNKVIEAMVVKKQLCMMVDKETIVDSVLEEIEPFVSAQTMLRVKYNIKVSVSKTL